MIKVDVTVFSDSLVNINVVRIIVFNTTFNNISVISWRSVLMVEETGQNQRPNKLYHIMLYQVRFSSPLAGFEPTTLVVIGTDCIGSCKSNYHTITTMSAPLNI
jgi:hypothetical protein